VPQVRKVYDFKSVGQLQATHDDIVDNVVVKKSIGIRTPISFVSTGNAMFNMSYDLGTQIRDNLKNLIATNHGERLMLGDFGANLRPLAMEMTAEDIDAEAVRRISAAVDKYMPFVNLETFEPKVERGDDNCIQSSVKVVYSVPDLGLNNQAVEAVILVGG
jgi:phage baseplate assembly protein W